MTLAEPCVFCNQAIELRCSTCKRAMCSEHYGREMAPRCRRCEDEWKRGSLSRTLTGLAIPGGVFVGLFVVAAGLLTLGVAETTVLWLLLAAFAIPVPLWAYVKHRQRARFRPVSDLPRAQLKT